MNETNFWQSGRIQTAFFWLLVIGIVFIGLKSFNELRGSSYIGKGDLQNVITVSGEGEAFAKPDTATFTFTIDEEAKTVPEAQKKVDDKSKAAFDFLEESGIEEKDFKTVSYQVYPKYEYPQQVICTQWGCPPQGEPKITGYHVSQTVEVKIRDIANAGDLLAGVGDIGVNNLSGLNFTVDNEEEIQAEARKQAIEEAKEKAVVLSKQLGVRLVGIVNFSENGAYPLYYKGLDAAAYGRGGAAEEALPSVAVAPGETRIVSNVTITYEIR